MKVILFILLFFPFISIAKMSAKTTIEDYKVSADSAAPNSTGMGTLTSVELAQKMVPGWNLGNTLEAIPNETSWGNPLTTQRLMDSVRAAGFHSVRIPVSWSSHFSDDSTYTIDSTWLRRVEQVVKYVLNDSMYAVVNEHWDGGWQQPTYADSAYVNYRLSVMWKQIAIHFRNYGDHLLFAGLNEVMVTNDYGTPKKEYYTVQNSFEQTFVNTIRSTGGRNYYRYLVVQGFNTNIDYTVNYFKIPVDVTPGRLLIEDHYYDPYDFTLNQNDKIIQWGKYATDPSRTETWANESWADNQFKKLKINYVDKGFGVIIGEYGATVRTNLKDPKTKHVSPELNAEYESYRRYYMQYITRSMERNQIVPYYWDIGAYGNHGSGIFDRNTGAHVYPDILAAIIDTSNVSPVLGVDESSSTHPVKFLLGQNYPNPFNPVTIIKYQLPKSSEVTIKVFDSLGREVAVLVNRDLKSVGTHEVEFNASNLSSGVYFYRLEALPLSNHGDSFIETKKLILIK